MRIYKFLVILLLFVSCSNAQQRQAKVTCRKVLDTLTKLYVHTPSSVDEMPEPIGGQIVLNNAIMKHLKYPPKEAAYFGKVSIAFIVKADGKLTGFRNIKDPSGNKDLFGSQLFQIAANLKWKPGSCNGNPVHVIHYLPLIIDINDQ